MLSLIDIKAGDSISGFMLIMTIEITWSKNLLFMVLLTINFLQVSFIPCLFLVFVCLLNEVCFDILVLFLT